MPKYGENIHPTSKQIKDILPSFLDNLSEKVEEKPERVILAWKELVGEQIGKMSRAIAFESGVLQVKVQNSTLLSLLIEHEKPRLLRALKKKFPKLKIQDISFKIG